jgi:hypothetical protein
MVRVNEDYVVDVDTLSYTAKEDLHNTNKKGEPTYHTIGYYGTLKQALLGIFEYKARKSLSKGEKSLYEAVKVLSDIKNELMQAIDKAAGEESGNFTD